ncbi:MAG TPA: GNAT family N-acetyltransferase [bacterium]|nr:GNAT family N-acetyltransferase [bacterium]
MQRIVIRTAKEKDVEALVAMRLELMEHVLESDPAASRVSERGREAVRPEIIARLKEDTNFLAIAETEDGTLVGMALAEMIANIYRVPDAFGHIHWLYVRPEFRRNGIAARLVRVICEFFKEWNLREITVGFVARNREAAVFWRALGFSPRIVHANIALDLLVEKSDRHCDSFEKS